MKSVDVALEQLNLSDAAKNQYPFASGRSCEVAEIARCRVEHASGTDPESCVELAQAGGSPSCRKKLSSNTIEHIPTPRRAITRSRSTYPTTSLTSLTSLYTVRHNGCFTAASTRRASCVPPSVPRSSFHTRHCRKERICLGPEGDDGARGAERGHG